MLVPRGRQTCSSTFTPVGGTNHVQVPSPGMHTVLIQETLGSHWPSMALRTKCTTPIYQMKTFKNLLVFPTMLHDTGVYYWQP